MLLAIDVGNTNVTLALFDGERLAADWRVTSHRERTADELAVELRQLFELQGFELSIVTGVVISSVVPGRKNHLYVPPGTGRPTITRSVSGRTGMSPARTRRVESVSRRSGRSRA